MQVELFVNQLTNAGLDMAMAQVTGQAGAWSTDWALTGPLIEKMKPTLSFNGETNAVEEILLPVLKDGLDYAPWMALIDDDGASANESGATLLQAFVRAYLALKIEDDVRISVDADTASTMLRDMDAVVNAIYQGSNKHTAEEIGPDRYLLRPLSSSSTDAEAFASVMRMLSLVDGQAIRRVAGSDATAVELELI